MKHNQTSFNVFYQVAIKILEIDPHREIGFAVCTGESAKNFGVINKPKLRIYLWNETLVSTEQSFNFLTF